MLALAWVGIFIKRTAVKFIKSEGILREVGRHPVKNDSYACVVSLVYKISKILGGAVA